MNITYGKKTFEIIASLWVIKNNKINILIQQYKYAILHKGIETWNSFDEEMSNMKSLKTKVMLYRHIYCQVVQINLILINDCLVLLFLNNII